MENYNEIEEEIVNFIMDKDQRQESINENVMGRKPHISCQILLMDKLGRVFKRLWLG